MTKKQLLALKPGDTIWAPWGEQLTLARDPIERHPGRGVRGRGIVLDFTDGTGSVIEPDQYGEWFSRAPA